MTPFRIAATQVSPNYLPEYLADELGYFADEDLAVSILAPEPWTLVLDLLGEDRADAVLGGAWLPPIYRRVKTYRIFAQLNARYPLALVTREPLKNGSWDSLRGGVVIVPSSGGPAAYMMFTGLLREAGIDPASFTFLRDLSHELYADLFAAGLGDAIVTYMLPARRLVAGGHGVLATSLDAVSGPMPNSVYYTTEEVLSRDDRPQRFTRALHRAMRWIEANGTDNAPVRAVLRKKWPEEDPERLENIVRAFADNGLWRGGVAVDRAALHRWQRFIAEAGLLSEPVPFGGLVDTRQVDFALGGDA
ncbi:MAG: ABC transporter substrate-binding protein [Paracoccaceae bacterium]